jgi:hypothetical protein
MAAGNVLLMTGFFLLGLPADQPFYDRNRNPGDGYRLMRVDFENGEPVADRTSKTAEIPVMENSNTGACPNSCFRPVGLDFDKKGRLYMSSDSSGEIYVIYGA